MTQPRVIDPGALDALIGELGARGFRVLGPTVRDGAIVYDDLASADALPIGITDVQQPGSYRLEARDDEARFGYAVGPHSWKQFLFPPRVRLWRASRRNGSLQIEPPEHAEAPLAFFGMRSCELHAMSIQDRVFLGGQHVEQDYAARRADAFVVAVNCFEILDGEHRFRVEAGSERGDESLGAVTSREATPVDLAAAGAAVERAVGLMGRELETGDLRDLLARNLEHPRWDKVADRCLTCGNCTMVCPTCFCTGVEDHTELAGEDTERIRSWDTCFSVDHSYIHGGAVRPSAPARYRQWLTHKFGTWHDQFDSSGCVGCGRCITWCPVGIDVTEELTAIRATDGGGDGNH